MTDAKEIAEEILDLAAKWSESHGGQREENLRTYERYCRTDAPALARAHLDALKLVADLRNERDAYRDAVAATKAAYPESVFRPESESKDAESARWARMVCDNISRRAEENMSEAADE